MTHRSGGAIVRVNLLVMMLGSGASFLLLAAGGVTAAAGRLNHAHRDRVLLRANEADTPVQLRP